LGGSSGVAGTTSPPLGEVTVTWAPRGVDSTAAGDCMEDPGTDGPGLVGVIIVSAADDTAVDPRGGLESSMLVLRRAARRGAPCTARTRETTTLIRLGSATSSISRAGHVPTFLVFFSPREILLDSWARASKRLCRDADCEISSTFPPPGCSELTLRRARARVHRYERRHGGLGGEGVSVRAPAQAHQVRATPPRRRAFRRMRVTRWTPREN
jgi:hypothetical protein